MHTRIPLELFPQSVSQSIKAGPGHTEIVLPPWSLEQHLSTILDIGVSSTQSSLCSTAVSAPSPTADCINSSQTICCYLHKTDNFESSLLRNQDKYERNLLTYERYIGGCKFARLNIIKSIIRFVYCRNGLSESGARQVDNITCIF